MDTTPALPGMEQAAAGARASGAATGHQASDDDVLGLRLLSPQRMQVQMRCCSVDELLPPEHPARLVWEVTGHLELAAFAAPIKAREHTAGRTPIDPRLLVALWLYASLDNVASGRRLAELCLSHVAYQWLCGEVGVNYHTLNDFRVGHAAALDALFTQVLARLMHQGLVKINRISQDGMRIRASAGSSSFKKQDKLQALLREAREHLSDLQKLRDESPALAKARTDAAQQAAAEDRARRVALAAQACQQVEADKQQRQSNKAKREAPARASTTDPDARRMKMADGGFRPAYNLQIASDPESRAVLAVTATTSGGDALELAAMRQEVLRRTGQPVTEQLADGGYVSKHNIEQAAAENVMVYLPVPEPQKEGIDRYVPRAGDSAAVAAWRERMGREASQEIYRERMSTSETVNADLKTWRGLGRFLVRGLAKVQCVALWSALAYNLMHFGQSLLAQAA